MKKYDLLAAGDTFLQTLTPGKQPFNRDIEELFKETDCSIINLETVLTERKQSKEQEFCFKANPEKVKYLRQVDVKAVNLANNHVLDYGTEGLNDTIDILNANNIGIIGILKNKKQNPFVCKTNDHTIGILGYYGKNPSENIIAPISEETILDDIKELIKNNIDHIVISLHWGEELVSYPSPSQQKLARRIIDCGADVIIGHHPHVIQGVEKYKNGIIFYSLGNFNLGIKYDYDKDFIYRTGIIALIGFNKTEIEFQCVPVKINDEFQPCLLDDNEKTGFFNHLQKISAPLNPKINERFWYREASLLYFKNHLPAFIRRTRKYGYKHFIQMIKWLIRPGIYRYYIGLIDMIIHKLTSKIRSTNYKDILYKAETKAI